MTSKRVTLRQTLRERQKGRCCYCAVEMVPYVSVAGRRVSGKCETLEHLRRKSDGGTNAIDNMALACATCNQSRGGLDWLTYKTMKMGEAHR